MRRLARLSQVDLPAEDRVLLGQAAAAAVQQQAAMSADQPGPVRFARARAQVLRDLSRHGATPAVREGAAAAAGSDAPRTGRCQCPPELVRFLRVLAAAAVEAAYQAIRGAL